MTRQLAGPVADGSGRCTGIEAARATRPVGTPQRFSIKIAAKASTTPRNRGTVRSPQSIPRLFLPTPTRIANLLHPVLIKSLPRRMPSFCRPRSPAMEEEEDLDSRNRKKSTVLQSTPGLETMRGSRRPRSTAVEEEEEEEEEWEKGSPPGIGSRKAKATKTTGQWDNWDDRWSDLDQGLKEKEPANDQDDWSDDDEDVETTVMPCYGGRFVRFNVGLATVFQVTAKYTPPIGFIAAGAYGSVCHAYDSEKCQQVAIKKIDDAFDNAAHAKLALREVMLLQHMNHRNIVALTDIIPPPQKELFNDLYIALELVETDMHRLIHSSNALTEDLCQSYLHQLLSGLKYLHSINILHRDLKPSNLLLTRDGTLKICDFGQARTLPRSDLYMTKRVGTLSYKSPEILLHASAYATAVDVWSTGCIFVELFLGKALFKGVDEDHQLRLIFELIGTPPEEADLGFLDITAQTDVRHYPYHPRQLLSEKLPSLSSLAIDLVEKMIKFDPRERITIENAMSHPYFEGLHEASIQSARPSPSCFDFEEETLTVEQIRDLIYNEALAFNPDFRKSGTVATGPPLNSSYRHPLSM